MTKRVLITAAAQGLGYAMAKAFTEDGAKVHVCDVDEAKLEAVKEELGLSYSLTDVSKPDEVAKLFEDAKASLGGLDVLINNVGIAGPTAKVEDIVPEDWDRTVAVNLNGHFYCIRQAVPLLKQSSSASIITISSTAGLFGFPLRAPYAASKWALIGLTKTLAMELGEFGIRVNAICPGSINNARMDGVIERDAKARGLTVESVREAYKNHVSLQTFIDPEDIAQMALFLSSDAGAKISGQALSVDGHTETLRS